MKKFFGLLLVSFIGLSMVSGEAEAQYTYGQRCCDSYGYARCTLRSPAPVYTPCVCYGIVGTGYTCI